MIREDTTDFERRGLNVLYQIELEEGFDTEFLTNSYLHDQITPKQRLVLWGLFFKYLNLFPDDDLKMVIEQVAIVSQTQTNVAVDEIKNFSSDLVFRLKRPFQAKK